MGLNVGVVGAAGYAGAELVRILMRHPEFNLALVTSSSDQGRKISDLYPAFKGICDLEFSAHDDERLYDLDLVFLATPHTVALSMVPGFLEAGINVIDLSADYRLKDPSLYEKWYGVTHTSKHLLARVAFGLPEITRDELDKAHLDFEAGQAVLVACAGCYPTASSLAAYPAIAMSEGLVVVDAISGVTGAGRSTTPRTHFCGANNNLEAYGVIKHRHTPEIEQILNIAGRLVFTPHLAPVNRGILSTVTFSLSEDYRRRMSAESLQALYEETYDRQYHPFVSVLPLGELPKTSSVVGTNNAHIGVAYCEEKHAVVATCAIDNLCKGAAGQAVQCANIVCGFPQVLGLEMVAMPV